jgi:peptidoglycan hydrolase-like protein with peptidoglycan-binding domain
MTLHVPRLPFALDPLIAEAKRRARQRRLLVVALALALVSAGVGAAFALRPSPSGSGSGAVSPSVAVVASQPVLSLGSRGPVVAAWQRLLDGWLRQSPADHWARAARARVGTIKVSGIFGRATDEATRYWQRDAYQKATGVVTLRTWKTWVGANVTCCGAGLPDFTPQVLHGFGLRPTGPVGWWQHALNLWRGKQGLRPIVLDGVYNVQTRGATGAFQRSVGLPATGVANAATWLKAQHMNILRFP